MFIRHTGMSKILIFPVILALMALACSFGSTSSPTLEPKEPTATSPGDQLAKPMSTVTFTLPPSIAGQISPQNQLSADSKQIPGGPILGNLDETQTAINERLKFLESAAVEKYSSVLPIGETQKYTIQVGNADERFMWQTGWCATQKNILTQNLEKLKFELRVNGQLVDLNTLVSGVYKMNGGTYCYMQYVVVYGWPSGTTTLQSNYTTTESINDGTNDYPAGKTTKIYEITRSKSPLISPNSTPIPGGPTLGSKAETQQAFGFQVTYLEDKADDFSPANQGFIDMYFGSDHTFTIHPDTARQHLMWVNGWCASDQNTLTQNLEKIQFEMSVNDQIVDLGQALTEDYRSMFDGSYCRSYRIIVYGWPNSKTTLKFKTTLSDTINNGSKDYSAGELIRTYEVFGP